MIYQVTIVKKMKLLLALEKFLFAFFISGLIFIIIFPFFQRLSIALRSSIDNTNPLVIFVPEKFTLNNLKRAYDNLKFVDTFINTFSISIICSVIQVVICGISGYAFSRLRFKGSNIFFYLVLFTLFIPNETLYVSRLQFFMRTPFFGIHLMESLYAILVMTIFGMGIKSPIFIYLYRQYFKNIPQELEEAAYVEGAGVVKTFFKVMLPSAKGANITVAVLSFLWQWNDYYFLMFFNASTKGFMTFSTMITSGIFRRSNIDAGSLIIMLPLLILYLLVQHKFLSENYTELLVG